MYIGTVELVVRSARGLLPMGSDLRADPYVRATLGAQQLKTKKQRHTPVRNLFVGPLFCRCHLHVAHPVR